MTVAHEAQAAFVVLPKDVMDSPSSWRLSANCRPSEPTAPPTASNSWPKVCSRRPDCCQLLSVESCLFLFVLGQRPLWIAAAVSVTRLLHRAILFGEA